MSDWTLPRSTSNLMDDWMAAARAYSAATTDAQRAAVRVRVEALVDRGQHGERMTDLDAARRDLGIMATLWAESWRRAWEAYAPVFTETFRRLAEQLERPPLVELGTVAPPDWAAAIRHHHDDEAQRTRPRHTGPAPLPLDPRRRGRRS